MTLRLEGGLGHPRRLARLAIEISRRPQVRRALLELLFKTPWESVALSDSVAGRALAAYFGERYLGLIPQNRLCRGVLLLPETHADYLRGRHRQALRTNLRRAALDGVRCEQCQDPGSALSAVREVLADRRRQPDDLARLMDVWEPVFSNPETTAIVARDPGGRTLALIAVVIDQHVALIKVAVASHHGARWGLHDHLVRMLIGQRVRYLLAEGEGPFGALGFAPELHHYQRLLGYELRHLVPHLDSTRACT